MTNDGLVGYRRADGVSGTTLVPDLATALPEPTDAGRRYTFQLRPNISFSDGEPVTPDAFRTAIERSLRPGTPRPDYSTRPSSVPPHVSRRPTDVTSHRGSWSTTRPARSPSSCVLPTRTSCTSSRCRSPSPCLRRRPIAPWSKPDGSRRRVPATGPYQIDSYDGTTTSSWKRNPAFRRVVDRRAARRLPRSDRVDVRARPDAQPDVRGAGRIAISSSRARVSPDQVQEVTTRFPSSHPTSHRSWSSVSSTLNTTRPPFDEVAARRAGEPRDRPRGGVPPVRWSRDPRVAELPGAATEHAWISAVLLRTH